MRLIGGLLALTFASSGWAAEHYVEVWNPPEASVRASGVRASGVRASGMPAARHPDAHASAAPARRVAQTKPAAKHKPPHRAAQAVKTRAHAPAATGRATDAPAARPAARPASGKLTVMQPSVPDSPHALDYTDIPRQLTPDGNVLRVGARNGSAKVTQ